MRSLAAPILLAASLGAGSALADAVTPPTPDEQTEAKANQQAAAKFAAMLWGSDTPKPGARACFARRYDAAHLKAHPHQHVVEIHVSVHYRPKSWLTTDDKPGPAHWGYAIEAQLKEGKRKTFRDDGSCNGRRTGEDNPSERRFLIRCDAACDAGDDLVVDNDGKKAHLGHSDLVHPELSEPGVDPKQAAKADDSAFLTAAGLFAAGPTLAAAADNRIIYHLSDRDKIAFVLGNIKNHYAAFPSDAPTIALVVHGEPLGDFRAVAGNERFIAPLRALMEKGLTPFACVNTLHWLKLALADLAPGFQLAERGGVVKLAELQQKGYVYIRP